VPPVGATLAGAFVAAVRREGLEPDPTLRLLSDHGPNPAAAPPEVLAGDVPVLRDPYDLGPLHEQLVAGPERVRRGAWYTPRWLAEELVALAVGDRGVVADPSCGGGVFLLAAADHLAARGHDPTEVVDQLWGCDLDPLAVAVAEAALWWWSARAGAAVRMGDRLVVGDALTDVAVPVAAAVVGNPPFLGQLRSDTTMSDQRRAALQARFGGVVRPYTDTAWLFLVLAVRAVAPGGRVALVQPQSVLGARDAAGVRTAVAELADVVDTWADNGAAFDASVSVCAPVLVRRDTDRGEVEARPRWTDALADVRHVPRIPSLNSRVLAEVATVHAGFRDEYYGLVDAIGEGGAGPRLVTVGAIDPCTHLADRPVRFANRQWRDPRVDVAVLDGRARRWAEVQAGPKILVATQTRVVEAVADPDGRLLGSVPVLCVRPHDVAQLWHLVAALHAPVISAWVVRRTIGTALSADACKPTAAVLCDLPLPEDGPAWDRAAALARRVSAGDAELDDLARAADAAYGIDDAGLHDWWTTRRPQR